MERTKKYLEEIKINIDYVGSNYGWNGIEEILLKRGYSISTLKKLESYESHINSSPIEVYQYEKDGQYRYCAELGYQTDIDDYCIETHIFTKKPSKKDVFTVRLISNVELNIALGRVDPIRKCWECGRKFHWLDNNQTSLEDKVEKSFKDNYCGC